MVRLDKIYTRGGDTGMTSLGDGQRVPKTNARIAAYGTVDELNAVLGMCLEHVSEERERAFLLGLQNTLFDLGADLCVPPSPEAAGSTSGSALRIQPASVERLERAIDEINEALPPLTSFILPGGNALASHLHLGRVVCRRAEREVQHLMETDGEEAVGAPALAYLNRLSDLLFVMARKAAGADEILWKPGQEGASGNDA